MKKGIEVIFTALQKAMKGEVRSYSESTFAIETIDLDIMFDTNLNAYLIEVNTKVGFNLVTTINDVDNYHEADLLIQWIFDNGIKKYIDYIQNTNSVRIENVLDLEVRDRMSFVDILTNISPWTKKKFTDWYFDNVKSKSTANIYRITISDKVISVAVFEPLPEELNKKQGVYLDLYFVPGMTIESKVNALKNIGNVNERRIYSYVETQENISVYTEAEWYKLSQNDTKSLFSNKFS